MTALWNSFAGTIASPLGFVLLLPLLAIVVLSLFWTARIVWWEYLLVVAVPVVFVVIVRGVSVGSQVHDVEWLRLKATDGWYEESWNRYVHRTCSSGSGKRRRVYDCSYVETVPPRWWARLSDGSRVDIGPGAFESLRRRWGGASFVEMHRPSFTRDGDAWRVTWDGAAGNALPWTLERAWENRIHAARSVFGYSPVSEATRRRLGVVDYPDGSGPGRPQVLGTSDPRADSVLALRNALGARDGAPSLFLVVFDGKGPEAGRAQEAHWEGGNRGEFVVCVGRRGGATTWAHVFSWTPDRKLVVEVRDAVAASGTQPLSAIADTVAARVLPRWKARDFHEFDYLRVEPTPRAILLALALALAACVGIGWWAVRNGHSLREATPPRWIPRPGSRRTRI